MKQRVSILISVFLLAACSNNTTKQQVTTEKANAAIGLSVNQIVGIGKIGPESDIIQLSSQVGGVVQKIYKKENDTVKSGEIVLELDHQVEDAKTKQLAEQLRTQTAQIMADEAAVEEYKAKCNNALSEVQRLQRLLDKGAETQQTFDDATTNLKVYQSNLTRLLANVQVSRDKLAETKGAIEVSEKEREQKIIRSPVNGKILEISTLIGSAVDSKQSFAQISPEEKTIAVCEIDELFADKIANGQKAWIRNLGSLDTLSTGTVYYAASFLKKKSLFTDQAGEKEDRRVREIKIMLDQPEKLLLNARVECVVNISGYQKQ